MTLNQVTEAGLSAQLLRLCGRLHNGREVKQVGVEASDISRHKQKEAKYRACFC